MAFCFIWTNVPRTNVVWTNVTVKANKPCINVWAQLAQLQLKLWGLDAGVGGEDQQRGEADVAV